jgi:hypothetical protein
MFRQLTSSGFVFAQLSGMEVVWVPDDAISLSVFTYRWVVY